MILQQLVTTLLLVAGLGVRPTVACKALPYLTCSAPAFLLSDRLADVIIQGQAPRPPVQDSLYADIDMDQSTTKQPSQDALRILCFGDSLTKGYTKWGFEHYPYGDTLQTELAQKLSLPLSKVIVHINGQSGDQVRGEYVKRMRASLKATTENPYDFIIIMGGTNDLGYGQPAQVIYYNLKVIWRMALESSSKVLALNVIEAASLNGSLTRQRNALNEMIANHSDHRFYSFDLWSVIKYHDVDPEYGYDVMGKAVAARIYEILQADTKDGDNSHEQ